MTDVFERTAEVLEKERQLLERNDALFGPLAAPVADVPPVRTSEADLTFANRSFNAATLVPGTRHAGLKAALLRVLSLYTNGQVSFNAAVVRVLNAWNERLSRLAPEISERLHDLQERQNRRITLVEERRNIWESRFSGEMRSLRERVSELEAGLSQIRSRLEEEQARVQRLEAEIKRDSSPVSR